jgi:hypothetical protein
VEIRRPARLSESASFSIVNHRLPECEVTDAAPAMFSFAMINAWGRHMQPVPQRLDCTRINEEAIAVFVARNSTVESRFITHTFQHANANPPKVRWLRGVSPDVLF